MEYLIDNTVIFRVDESVLINNENVEQRIELTLTVSRLLHLLVCHHGEVLPRETIFKHVWEDYGLDASNNSLSQYISLLRSAFRTMEVHGDIIQTVPRIGFMLSAELIIVERGVDTKSSHLNEYTEGAEIISPDVISDKFQHSARLRHRVLFLLIMLSLFIMVCMGILLLKPRPYSLNSIPVGYYKECRVLNLPMYEHDLNRPSQMLIDAIITESGLSCQSGGDLYIHIDGNVEKGNRGKVWVSSCEHRKEDGVLQCSDYLSNDWRMSQ